MNDLEKFFRKQPLKERKILRSFLAEIRSGNFENHDIKKLTGHKNLFRIRKGKFRIIFELKNNKVFIKKVTKRNENTYENL